MAFWKITGDPRSVGCASALVGDLVEDKTTGTTYVRIGTGTFDFTTASSAFTTPTTPTGTVTTIEEADGSPSYSTSVTTLRFDQADGFVLTNPVAGVVRVDLANVPESAVANLVTDLASKASSTHTHAESDITNLVTDLAAKEATANKGAANGYCGLDSGGLVANTSLQTALTANARVAVSKGGTAVATRRGINFIEGSNVTLTVADNSGSERVDVTVATSGSGSAAPDISLLSAGTTLDPLSDYVDALHGASTLKYLARTWWVYAAPLVDLRPLSTSSPQGAWSVIGTPATLTGDTTHFGGVDLNFSSATTGYYLTNTSAIALGGAKYRFRAVVASGADVTGGTWRIGFSDDGTGSPNNNPSNGVFFRWASSVNTSKFQCVNRAAGVENAVDSTVTIATSTKYVLEFEVNAAASSVSFSVNGTTVTNASNIPTAAMGAIVGQGAGQTNLSFYRATIWADDALVS